MKDVEIALEYALRLLKEVTEAGNYPKSALLKNGGHGFQPIVSAIRKLRELEDNLFTKNLRDEFAAKAMQGYISSIKSDGLALNYESIATHSFKMADAMLKVKELNKDKEND